jgi:hypothetical protein
LIRIQKHISILLIAALSGCNLIEKPEQTGVPVARVHDAFLYLEDVAPQIPAGLSEEDSTLLIHNIIYKWGREQLLIQKAEFNLPEDMVEIEELVRDYRSYLIKFAYQQEYVNNHLDTAISQEELKEYYENNASNFELKEIILKAKYYVFPTDLPDVKKTKRWFMGNSKSYNEKFQDAVFNYALVSVEEDTTWIPFEEIVKVVPLKTYNQQEFLAKNRKVTLEDSLGLYCLEIQQYKIKDDVSPLPYVKETIRSIILNQRKLDLIKKMEDEIFNEAYEKKDFEIL